MEKARRSKCLFELTAGPWTSQKRPHHTRLKRLFRILHASLSLGSTGCGAEPTAEAERWKIC